MTVPIRPIKASALLRRSSPPACNRRRSFGRINQILSTEQTAHTKTCAQKGTINEAPMAIKAPIAKHVTKKSPELNSKIRQPNMIIAQISHKFPTM